MTRRILFALAGLLLSCMSTVRGQEADPEMRAHFLLARQAQASGNLDVAVQEYLTVIKLAPDLPEARVNLGLVYYLQTRYGESAQALEKALSLQPGFRGANLFLGIDEVKLGQTREAVPYLKRAVEQEPGNKEARTWLSRALWDAGQKNESILELRNAAQAFPSDPDILFLLGQAYRNAADEEMGHVLAVAETPLYHQAVGDIYKEERGWDQAQRHYQRALEKDPHWVGAHLGLGEIYFQQGKWDAARAEFLAERSPGATAKLAQIALLEGQPSEGLRLLSEAIQKGPAAAASALGLPPLPFVDNSPSGEEVKTRYRQSLSVLEQSPPSSPARSLALASIDQRLGLSQKAAQEWGNYRAILPAQNLTGNDYERALREFEQHDFDGARSRLVAFLAAHPEDGQAHYLLAKTCHSLSLSVLADMLSSAPDSPRTHQLYALTLAEQEANDKALAEYRKVETAAPAVSGLHFAIGELLWKMKRPDQALAEFEQELRLNPGHAEASAAAGTILVSEHQTDRAIPYLQRAVQLKPALLLAHLELGKAFYQRREFLQAEPELKKALAADPDGSIHYFLGVAYRELGRDADARVAFAESSRIKDKRLSTIRAEKLKDVEP
jgi:tetratricopeptide (TPR) repeat protein